MLFNSYIFIFGFLPISLFVYFSLNYCEHNRTAKIWLVICSIYFYAYFNISYLWIIITSVVVNYLITLGLSRIYKAQVIKKILLSFGLLLNIGILFFYKYLDFLFECTGRLFKTDLIHLGLILPLGISFFTFQQISYLIDTYKGKTPVYHIIDYSLFITFFPQLIAGPIVLHNEVIPQFMRKKNQNFNADNFAIGIYAFARGLAKKVLIADNFGKIVSFGYGNIQTLSSFETVLTILAYSLQIYFDFSGYCDMASGIARMFNIELPINFNSPYKARNISDFWKRWHMTLTRFLTNYIYIPLGGNRRSTLRTYFNILIVFLVSGFWHGAGFTFIIWGLMHGIAMISYRFLKRFIDRLPYTITWIITFIFISLMWVYFRAPSITDANLLISRLFSGGFTLNYEITEILLNIIPISVVTNIFDFKWTLCTLIIVIFLGFIIACITTENVQDSLKRFKPKPWNLCSSYILLIWSILSLSGVSTFLYFNF